jgi:hypothetical protein
VSTLQVIIQLPEGEDDPTNFLFRVLSDMRSQGRWQIANLTSEKGVPLRDPQTFMPVGAITVRG